MFTVLGGGGFIGSQLVRDLERGGYDVFSPKRGDCTLDFKNLGHVIYCIGLTSDFRSRPFATVQAHVSALAEVLEKARFDSLLYVSSTRVYGKISTASETSQLAVESTDPSDLYNISKLMGESLCLNCGRENVRVARLSNVYGADFHSGNFLTSLIRQAIQSDHITLQSTLDSVKDYVSLTDVAAVLPRIAIAGNERIYNVASGCNVSNGQIAKQLSMLTGCKVEVMPGSPLISFPVIDTGRIRTEFSFAARSLLDDLPKLVKQFQIEERA